MNRTSRFYAEPSKMNAYPMYERRQIKQVGGEVSTAEKVSRILSVPALMGALFADAREKVNRDYASQYKRAGITNYF